MLRQIVTNKLNKSSKQWFQSSYFNLVIFSNTDGQVVHFELCYNRHAKEKVFMWSIKYGYQLASLEDERDTGAAKMSQLHIYDQDFNKIALLTQFKLESANIDSDLIAQVQNLLESYPLL